MVSGKGSPPRIPDDDYEVDFDDADEVIELDEGEAYEDGEYDFEDMGEG